MLEVTQLVNGKRKEGKTTSGWRDTFEEILGIARSWLRSRQAHSNRQVFSVPWRYKCSL